MGFSIPPYRSAGGRMGTARDAKIKNAPARVLISSRGEGPSFRVTKSPEGRIGVPRILGTERLHPQGNAAEDVAPLISPTPVGADQRALTPAQPEAVAARAAGVGARPVVVERDALAGRLVVGQDEAGEEGDTAEGGEVVRRELEAGAGLGEEPELLGDVLGCAPGHDARNPENQAVLRRFVREVPALQVLEVAVAGAELGSVLLQGETSADAVAEEGRVRHAPRGGEAAVLLQGGQLFQGDISAMERCEEVALFRSYLPDSNACRRNSAHDGRRGARLGCNWLRGRPRCSRIRCGRWLRRVEPRKEFSPTLLRVEFRIEQRHGVPPFC